MANAIVLDGSGDAYITGTTACSDFPTTPGAFQPTMPSGGHPAFVLELNSAGTSLIYSTFLGGNSYDQAYGIALDGNGDAYVAGDTSSTNFPTTSGAYQTTMPSGNNPAFVAELNPSGTALVYSTFLGGNSGEFAYGIALDGNGDAYVTGTTYSTDFPTTSGAYQTADPTGTATGFSHAYVTELNSAGVNLIYSTYLGGNNADYASGIVLDGNRDAYVVGSTNSTNFPTTSGAFQTADPTGATTGFSHAYVAEINFTGASLVYSTYLGGNANDNGSALVLDGNGNIYVTGQTNSSNFPTTPGAFQPTDPSDYYHAYLTELSPADETNPVYSTYFGGAENNDGLGIAIDGSGAVYLTGWTDCYFPTTYGAFQTNPYSLANIDAFASKFDASNFYTPTVLTTPTQTFSPTTNATSTNTPGNTSTSTLTATSTNTQTFTATCTATQTPTSTATNTPTVTATNSQTATPTFTNTTTPTATPTVTATQTPTRPRRSRRPLLPR